MSKESTGKRITNELRHNIEDAAQLYGCECKRLLAIADRIDAAYNAAYQDGENAILAVFDKRGNADVDERMAEHGWYRALDADKKPIRIGDVMDGIDKYNSLREITGRVITVIFEADGLVDVAVQAWNDDGKSWRRAYLDPDASVYCHHKQPTVEDLLCELLDKVDDDRAGQAEIIAEYAKRLRLAGDAE